jgi:hypothetical protein
LSLGSSFIGTKFGFSLSSFLFFFLCFDGLGLLDSSPSSSAAIKSILNSSSPSSSFLSFTAPLRKLGDKNLPFVFLSFSFSFYALMG